MLLSRNVCRHSKFQSVAIYIYIYINIQSCKSNEFIIFAWNEVHSFHKGCQSDGTSTIGGNQPSPTWSHRTPSSSTKASSQAVNTHKYPALHCISLYYILYAIYIQKPYNLQICQYMSISMSLTSTGAMAGLPATILPPALSSWGFPFLRLKCEHHQPIKMLLHCLAKSS